MPEHICNWLIKETQKQLYSKKERDQKRRQEAEQTLMTSQWEGVGCPSQQTEGKDPDSVLFLQTTPKTEVCIRLFLPRDFWFFPLSAPPLSVWMITVSLFSNQVPGTSSLE